MACLVEGNKVCCLSVRRYKVVKGTYATEQEYRQVERRQIEYRTGTMNYDQKLSAATYKNACPDLERKLSTNCITTSILILLYSIGNNYLFQELQNTKKRSSMEFSYDGNNGICHFPGPCRFIILLRELDTCVIEKDSFLSTNQAAKTA